jgi:hypothetical protein
MSGFTDVTQIVIQQQNLIQVLGAIEQQLARGILLNPAPSSYTVAALPATASAGTYAWASNGRKPAEGAGAGTGVPVFWNPTTNQWFSFLSGAVVTA